MKKRKEASLAAVREAIKTAPFTLHDLAREAGISYDSLRSWSVGRRDPRTASVRRLSAGLRRKAASLIELADSLDRTTTRASRS